MTHHHVENLINLTRTPLGLQEINRLVHHHCHAEPLFLIFRPLHGAYYRPNAAGYTIEPSAAWKVTAEEGKTHTLYADSKPGDSCYSERVILEPVPPMDYSGSRDTMATAEQTLDEREQRMSADRLHYLTRGLRGSFHHCCAKPHLRAVAFIHTKQDA